MNRFHLSILFLALIGLLAMTSCKTTKQAGGTSPILLEFPQGSVTQEEFERVYAKNNQGEVVATSHSEAQYREYLDLYINFKRKVFEAQAMGIDTTPSFQQEFNSYKQQLTQPYLAAKDVEDQLIQEAYDRSGYLVDASHLLITLTPQATPADTLLAYQRIVTLRDSIVKLNKDFGEMAAKYSNDPSAKQNQGRLGYFSAFDMVYPFESGAFTTPVGEVSEPVRSQFGYHIIKVHDKMVNQGKKRAAHIIVRVGDRYSAKTEEEAQAKIKEIYQRLETGDDFKALAMQFSDDPSTGSNGGDLGFSRLLPEMETYRLQLGEGEYSEPFSTQYGWHILQVTEVDERQNFDEAKPQLKQRISRDSRAQLSRDALLNRIKTESGYQLQEANFTQFIGTLDERFSRGAWEPDSAQGDMYALPLFVLTKGSLTKSIQDFVTYYRRMRPRKMGMTEGDAAYAVLNTYVEEELLKYEEAQLPDKNPEYRYLLQEYRDGILLFTLMEQKVWKRAVEDTLGLKAFYEAHPDSFSRNQMVEVVEYRSSEAEALQEVKALLAQGFTQAQIDSTVNRESSIRLRSTTMLYEAQKDAVPEILFTNPVGTITEVEQEGSFYRLLVSTEKFPAGIQPLENVKSEAITRYQDHLEREWLAELAVKYPVSINEKAFGKLFR